MNTVNCENLDEFASLCAKFTALGLRFRAYVENGTATIEITGY